MTMNGRWCQIHEELNAWRRKLRMVTNGGWHQADEVDADEVVGLNG